jgi:two-component system KDP operon response regulator KdpE
MSKQRILIVDDEPQITRVLHRGISAQGYETRTASDGATALDIMKEWQPDLVITDLAMPKVNGLELCRQLRATSEIPIIVLSVRAEEQTKVQALDIGADDFITKPFSMAELLARIRAALRRAPLPQAEEANANVLEAGDFRIDLELRSVTIRERVVHLTPKEFDLLVYLMQHPYKVLTHRTVLTALWGGNYVEQTEYLRVFIGQLRKKIEADSASPQYILTEPWIGYRFDPGT